MQVQRCPRFAACRRAAPGAQFRVRAGLQAGVLTGLLAGLLAGCPGAGGPSACAPGEPNPQATVSYASDVRPILSANGCLTAGCHGSTLSGSSFDLRTYESSFSAGVQARDRGVCPIVPGDPDGSYLMQKLRDPPVGGRMPLLRDPLSDAELETIATWIREGAPDN